MHASVRACVSASVRARTCECGRERARKRAHMDISEHACVSACMFVLACACVAQRSRPRSALDGSGRTCVCVSVWVSVRARVRVCTSACVCASVCVLFGGVAARVRACMHVRRRASVFCSCASEKYFAVYRVFPGYSRSHWDAFETWGSPHRVAASTRCRLRGDRHAQRT